MTFSHALVAAYLVILGTLMLYCLHRYLILYLYVKHKKNYLPPAQGPPTLPRVTVQLPLYNEQYVVRRLIHAAARLCYPAGLLEIQVLDDSTDETAGIARECVAGLQQQGHAITLIHRAERAGYKAGALQQGLLQARGDLIAVFDADFVPEPDCLLRVVPFFATPLVGMVQCRWGHINRRYSVLTRLQALLLDAHFILEHTARNRSGRFFNFNGTAGIWRRQCILDAGGWQHDTLTEDLDLSYRAQLRGWQFVFLPDLVAPGEIPVDMNSFKSQQHRWTKGGIETARKLLPAILKSRQPLKVKCEALVHLTANLNYLLMAALAVLAYPALVIRINQGWKHLFVCDLLCFVLSVVPIALYYGLAARRTGGSCWQAILCLPLLMALGIGLSINNGRGVFEALAGVRSSFLRTPKFKIENRADTWRYKRYRGSDGLAQALLEVGFGFYFLMAILFALRCSVYASLPFLTLFCAGFLYVGLLSLYQKYAFCSTEGAA